MSQRIERPASISFTQNSETVEELLPGWKAYVNVRTDGPTFLVCFEHSTDIWSAKITLSTMNKMTEWEVINQITGERTKDDWGKTLKRELPKMLAAIEAIEKSVIPTERDAFRENRSAIIAERNARLVAEYEARKQVNEAGRRI